MTRWIVTCSFSVKVSEPVKRERLFVSQRVCVPEILFGLREPANRIVAELLGELFRRTRSGPANIALYLGKLPIVLCRINTAALRVDLAVTVIVFMQ